MFLVGGFLSSDSGKYQHLWRLLNEKEVLTKDQFRLAQNSARDERRHLSEVLLTMPGVEPEAVLEALASFYNLPVVTLRTRVISPYVLNLIPREVAAQHLVVVFKKVKGEVHVATVAPENRQTMDFIEKKTGFQPQIFLTTPADIQHALGKYPGEIATEFAQIIAAGVKAATSGEDSAEQMAQNLPIAQMLTTLLERALNRSASDIHIEATGEQVVVRYRVDGLLRRVVELPPELLPSLAARIKLLANLKIDEHRLPQDGRFTYAFRDREVAVRVSILPTLHGPKIALRLLDAKRQQFTLTGLGLNKSDYKTLREQIARPHGMVLVTGPTGSGKTTTLYTLLRLLNKERSNICTIEDPIEYGMTGINQTQVNPTVGLTFANGLRSLLRQDPNVLMVGEIRDAETADISVNAAMTGHLLLSTLHTNTAFLAPQRLKEMGVAPFLVASVTNLIIGQRLVRQTCTHCGTKVKITPKMLAPYAERLDLPAVIAQLQKFNLLPSHTNIDHLTINVGRGCDKCGQSGYQGRIGIYELLVIDEPTHEAIVSGASGADLRKLASQHGRLTMVEDGILKVLNGVTTLSEVFRVTA